MTKTHLVIVLCTAANIKEARKIAVALLDQKLAACVSLIPNIESHYVWQKKRERAREVLLVIKTKKGLFRRVEAAILKAHSYECPEILEIQVNQAFKPYMSWVFGRIIRHKKRKK